jgi:hypothetical protein
MLSFEKAPAVGDAVGMNEAAIQKEAVAELVMGKGWPYAAAAASDATSSTE